MNETFIFNKYNTSFNFILQFAIFKFPNVVRQFKVNNTWNLMELISLYSGK